LEDMVINYHQRMLTMASLHITNEYLHIYLTLSRLWYEMQEPNEQVTFFLVHLHASNKNSVMVVHK
jgi:hypothetical protein